jgi:hypothetical protein
MFLAVVDKNADLLRADFVGSIAKDKEHGVNDVTLAAAIGAHNTRQTLHIDIH